MPATSFLDYAQAIETILNYSAATGDTNLVNIKIDLRSSLRGFIAGLLRFLDNSELHFRRDLSVP